MIKCAPFKAEYDKTKIDITKSFQWYEKFIEKEKLYF